RAVVTDEELVSRRGVVVEHMLRGLGDQRPIAQHHELVTLAGETEMLGPLWRLGALRESGRHEPTRHVGRERNGAAERRAHRGKPGSTQEPTAADTGCATEYKRVGALRIGVKLVERALNFIHHGVLQAKPFSLTLTWAEI